MTRNKIIDNDMVLLKDVSFNSLFPMSESHLSSNSQSSFNFYMHAFFAIFILACAYFFFFSFFSFFSFGTVIPKRFASDDEKLKILSIFKHSHCNENLYFSNHQYVNFHQFLLLIT